jgi:hypothetical protein
VSLSGIKGLNRVGEEVKDDERTGRPKLIRQMKMWKKGGNWFILKDNYVYK